MKVVSRVGTVLYSDDAVYALIELLERASKLGINLRDADLCARDLRHAKLSSIKLDLADLQGAQLAACDLRYASLRFAKLAGADAKGASFRGADLFNADLRRVDLRGADLSQASVLGTEWAEACYDDKTKLPFSRAEADSRGLVVKPV